MESGNIAELADPRMEGKYDGEQLYRVVLAASYCVRQTATWRPPMSEVNEQHRPCLSFSQSQQDHTQFMFFSFWFYAGVRAANQWRRQ